MINSFLPIILYIGIYIGIFIILNIKKNKFLKQNPENQNLINFYDTKNNFYKFSIIFYISVLVFLLLGFIGLIFLGKDSDSIGEFFPFIILGLFGFIEWRVRKKFIELEVLKNNYDPKKLKTILGVDIWLAALTILAYYFFIEVFIVNILLKQPLGVSLIGIVLTIFGIIVLLTRFFYRYSFDKKLGKKLLTFYIIDIFLIIILVLMIYSTKRPTYYGE